jgi:membrane protease YdiL (CAAX protease family)
VRNNSTWALSALSPTPWPREAWNVPLTILAAIGAVVFAIVPGIVYVVFATVTGAIDPHHPRNVPADQLLIAQVVTYVPLGIYLAIVLPRLSLVSLRDLGLRAPTARELGIALGGTVAMWLIVTIVGTALAALTHRQDTEAAVAVLKQMHTPGEKLLFFTIACVLAPMIEELAFRVFLFNAFTRYASLPVAALASGALFGVVHSSSLGQLLTVSVPLALGGVVLAYVYAATRCYWANVTTHAVFNSISVIAIFVFHAKP